MSLLKSIKGNLEYQKVINWWQDSLIFKIIRIGILLVVMIGLAWGSYGFLQYLLKIGISDIYGNRISTTNVLYLFVTSALLATIASTIWAVQVYWRLRYIDKRAHSWKPTERKVKKLIMTGQIHSHFTNSPSRIKNGRSFGFAGVWLYFWEE